MAYRSGRHFLQIPGPTNVPGRVLRAMARPTIDHRGPEFRDLAQEVLVGVRRVFQTRHPVVIYPASGTGAWEAALVNTLAPGDRVLMVETGHFATLWKRLAEKLGLQPIFLPGDWRHGVDPGAVEARLAEDTEQSIKAVCVVHNETSTGATSKVPLVREALNRVDHPALFIVDTISSLASIDYRHDEWQVDVTVGASQKGLMLPPGLSFNALSERALTAHARGGFPRSYWDWSSMLSANEKGLFPYTPATNLLFGLREALRMLDEEGLPNVFARHHRHAAATRRAVEAWGLELVCLDSEDYSASVTAVMMPPGSETKTEQLLCVCLERFDLALGVGLGKLAGRAFRIGHLGDFNDLSLVGTLAGVEMSLALSGVPHTSGGVGAATTFLAEQARAAEALR